MKFKQTVPSPGKHTPTSFDPGSGGAVPTSVSENNDNVKQATQAKQATSAKNATKDPDKTPKTQFSLTMLKAPKDDIVAEIADVGKKYNKNSDMLYEIIQDVLKACFYFNVTDIHHIAYIFATIARETTFGVNLVEEKTYPYLSKLYEPVFIAEMLVDLKGLKILILQEHFLVAALKFIELITSHGKESVPEYVKKGIREIIVRLEPTMTPELFQEFNSVLLKKTNGQEIGNVIFQLIIQYVDTIILKFDDPTSQVFLAGINNRDGEAVTFLREILKQIAGSHLNAENKKSHSTEHNNVRDLATIIQFSRKLINADLSENNEGIATTKMQLKIVMLHWLIMRVHKSHGLGNTTIGDGEKYRGRGLVQLTGRGLYTTYAKHIQSPIFSKAIKAIASQDPPDIIEEPEAAKNINLASIIAVGGLAQAGFRKPRLNMSNNKFIISGTFDFNLAREIVNKDHANLESLADPFLTVLQNQIN